MFEINLDDASDKTALYESLARQARSLLEGERDAVANGANLSSLIFHGLPDINWAGIYFHRDGELVVGPFQGKPACVRIGMGKGVCGTAAAERRTMVVADVDRFPGHIPCDSASRSEVVVPLVDSSGTLLGVLDVDSPIAARFDDIDARGIETLARAYVDSLG